MPPFEEILAGVHAMDKHFKVLTWRKTSLLLLVLVGVWNSTFLEVNVHTVLNLPSFMG